MVINITQDFEITEINIDIKNSEIEVLSILPNQHIVSFKSELSVELAETIKRNVINYFNKNKEVLDL